MEHKSKLLVDFEVERLETTDDQKQHVIGRLHDQNIVIRATIVVLAAGALEHTRHLIELDCGTMALRHRQ